MQKNTYGLVLNEQWSQYQVEVFLFYWGQQLAENPTRHPSVEGKGWYDGPMYTGEGRYTHFKALAVMIFPKIFEWNDWSDKIARALCENKHVSICGCAASSKSTTTGLYAFFWYICAPNNSAVLIASTTLDAAKKRIWKEVRRFYVDFIRQIRKFGDTVLVTSPKPAIRTSSSDTAHGIYVVAVAKGEEQKGIDQLKGFHPDRMLMIGDETDAISQAIVDVGANQEVGTIEYQTIWLGNDPSLFNPLGQMMQPEIGKAVGLQHVEWTSVRGYKCLRLDAFDSPNIRDKDKWKGIIRKKDIDSTIARFGENHPQVWIMLRGIHPPEGADDTVLSEALFLRHGCQLGVVWKRTFVISGLLDPAFGGDRCIFRTMCRGQDTEGKMRLLFSTPIEIQIAANDPTNPPEYQIASKVKSLCESQGIDPNEFCMDGSGRGGGVAAVLQREWAPTINVIQFGGACSPFPVSEEDPRPANEVYDRKVTELWYSFREFVEAGMIRGLDGETAAEFCRRKFEIKGKKISVMAKDEMKKMGVESPDLADCAVLGIYHVREKGVQASVMTDTKKDFSKDYSRKINEYDIDGQQTYRPALDDAMVVDYMNF